MSIPSIPNISDVGRVPGSTPGRTPTSTSPAPGRQGGGNATAATGTGGEGVPAQPSPPRFPWLSRLSQQLEQAARQKPTFAPAPVIGDNIDRSA